MQMVPVEVGQRWALQDYRYGGEWRYLTVESVDESHVVVRSRSGRRSTWTARRFGRGNRFVFCGYDGPGLLPVFTGINRSGCGNAPPYPLELPLEHELEPGFGMVRVTRDGETVWSCGSSTRKRLAHIELQARETPGDWRLQELLPLGETLYQRQGVSRWVLVAVGMGFA